NTNTTSNSTTMPAGVSEANSGSAASSAEQEGAASAMMPVSYQPPVPAISPETLSKLRMLLRTMQNRSVDQRQQQDWALQLGNLGDDLLPALEALHRERVPIPEFVYQEVLPEQSVVFRSLADLSSPAVDVRRRAAVALRAASQAQPLSLLAMDRLCTVAEAEKDALVWQTLVDVAGTSGTGDGAVQATDRFWQLALEHPQSEVRRRACEQVGRLRRVRLASSLAKLGDDTDSHVARAAARAPGAPRPPAGSAAAAKIAAPRGPSVGGVGAA